jgi:hypothetical protein
LANEFAFLTKLPNDEVYELTLRKLADDQIVKEENSEECSYVDNKGLNKEQEKPDGFRQLYSDILKNPAIFVKYISEKYPAETLLFLTNFMTRLKRTNMKIEQVFNLIILEEDAVTKLKEFLVYPAGNVEYLSSPKYQLNVSGQDEQTCDVAISAFVSHMKTKLGTTKCVFKLDEKKLPRIRNIR